MPGTQSDNDQWRLVTTDGHGSHTSTGSSRTCRQDNAHLLFLPAHTFDVLQPSDLDVFVPRAFPSPNCGAGLNLQPELRLVDGLPIKNNRFVTRCNLVRKGTFAPRLLRTVWQAAGLYPFDLDRPEFITTLSSEATSISPPPPREEIKPVPTTPTSSRYTQTSYRTRSRERWREPSTILNSTQGWLLNASHFAHMYLDNQSQAQFDAIATQKRKNVQTNPDAQLANIDNIFIAKQAQALFEERKAARQARYDATTGVRELKQQSSKQLHFGWQMDDIC